VTAKYIEWILVDIQCLDERPVEEILSSFSRKKVDVVVAVVVVAAIAQKHGMPAEQQTKRYCFDHCCRLNAKGIVLVL
jgi:hypothetical protein